jgi:hypothetical protein
MRKSTVLMCAAVAGALATFAAPAAAAGTSSGQVTAVTADATGHVTVAWQVTTPIGRANAAMSVCVGSALDVLDPSLVPSPGRRPRAACRR